MISRRAFVALAAVFLAAGCSKSGDVNFTITKTYNNVTSSGGAFAPAPAHVDISQEAPEAWSHRDKVQSIDLVGVDATITAITPTPTTVGGTITMVRGTSRALVDTIAPTAVTAAPHSMADMLNPAGMAIVNDAVHDDGKFDVEFAGTTSNAVTFSATVTMHMKLTYKIEAKLF